MSFINLFSNPVGIYENPDHLSIEQDLSNKSFEIQKEHKSGGKDWLTNIYNTHKSYDPSNDKNFFNLFRWIDSCIINYCNEFEFSNKIKSNLSWINIYNKGDYQEMHDHAESHLSCIYCIKGSNKSSRIFFKRQQNMFRIPVTNNNTTNCDWHYFPFIKGTLYIFESKLYHYVEKHELDEPRISLACNFILE